MNWRSTLTTAGVLGWSSFRQGLRGRLELLFVAAIGGVLLLGTVFRQFEADRALELRLVLETGLASAALLVLGTALLLGSQGVGGDGDRTELAALLTLPVPRAGVLLGHVLGVVLTLGSFALGMALALTVVLVWRFGEARPALLVHFATLVAEGALLASLATLFALGRSRIVAFFATLAVALVAHAESVVTHLANDSGSAATGALVATLARLLPPVAALDVKASVVRGLAMDHARLAWASGHGLLYLAAVLALAAVLFERSEP